MIAQLSTSWSDRQLTIDGNRFIITLLAGVLLSMITLTPSWAQSSSWQQPSAIEQRIEPLSAIDRQFMANQRADVEQRANALGRQLSGNSQRDLDTLQRLLDTGAVTRDDLLGLQAMGVVLGDLLSAELRMEWVVYRDRAGRSRALHYPNTDVYLFPITMISRRYSVGVNKPVSDIFNEVATDTAKRLPGAKWR